MQIILFKNIERLGMQGDIVNVAGGYFRNYLGPHGLAVEATAGTLKRLDLKRKKLQVEAEGQRNEAKAMAKRLSEVELTFTRKATDGQKLFGSVTEHDILERLKEAGFEFERKNLLIRDAIKTVGTHPFRIRLESNLLVDMKVHVEPEGGVPEDTPTVAVEEAPESEAAPQAAAPAEAPAAEAKAAEAEAEAAPKKKRAKKSAEAE